MRFRDFMEMALYEPGQGYYVSGLHKLGEQGDFVTAPELGSLLGACLARQIAEVFGQSAIEQILEFGAGTGQLALSILKQLRVLEALPLRYRILEVSPDLRERQRQLFLRQAPQLLPLVDWIDTLPAHLPPSLIIANEVLDAMPCDRVQRGGGDWLVAAVARHGNDFAWHSTAAPASLNACLQPLRTMDLTDGYVSEINTTALSWVKTLGRSLTQALVLLIDYGYPRNEFYHWQRSGGTLMCHYRHRAHDDPLIRVGLQDITAHVDFSAVACAAETGGMSVLGYTHQAAFLLALGITEIAAEIPGTGNLPDLQLAQEIKRLTLPGQMGEQFKVMALAKDLDMELRGFSLRDDRIKL